MKLWLLGVRGSTPAPGASFVRYGGHTSCVAIAPDDGDVPTLVLDAGTGLRSLSTMLPGPAFSGSIVLSHLHWDHVQGIPFFVAGDQADSHVDVYLPSQGGRSGRELLAQLMSPPAFPITPEGLRGRWTFTALEPGAHTIGGFQVTAAEVAHKGGRTYGYRVSDGSGSIAYLPDHAPVQGCSDDVLDLLQGVDLLVHDAQFLESERAIADQFGHATIEETIALASRTDVATLVLFHHGPARTDDQLDAISRHLETSQTTGRPIIVMAAEGDLLRLPHH